MLQNRILQKIYSMRSKMTEVEREQLRQAVESQHGCTATLKQLVPVKGIFGGTAAWDGIAHIFEITGHLTARQAYAWSSPIEGSDKRRFFAVLHQPPVMSPVEAGRAAIVAESKAQ